MQEIRDFFIRFGQDDAYDHSNEVKVLKRFAPRHPQEDADRSDREASIAALPSRQAEDYEHAAKLRDEIKRREDKVKAGETSHAPRKSASVRQPRQS